MYKWPVIWVSIVRQCQKAKIPKNFLTGLPDMAIFENWVCWNNYIFRTFLGPRAKFLVMKSWSLEVESDFCFCLFWRKPFFKIAISGNSVGKLLRFLLFCINLQGRIIMQKDKPIHLILPDQPYFDSVSRQGVTASIHPKKSYMCWF